MSEPTRTLIRYYGGKWRLARWIIAHFPDHRVYVEPYGGGASVLLRKPRSYAEVYNELDGEIVNLFRVLRDEASAARFIESLRLTPFARAEFEHAYEPTEDAVERARRLIVRCFMGFGSNAHNRNRKTGFRSNSNRSGTTPAHDWMNYPAALPAFVERVRGIVIENRDALDCMRQHDGAGTLHYVDPPYVHSTRSAKNKYDLDYGGYFREMSDTDHEALLAFLRTLEGYVVLSGYPHPLYVRALPDWRVIETQAFADGARPRTEAIWLNPRCAQALEDRPKELPLLEDAAA